MSSAADKLGTTSEQEISGQSDTLCGDMIPEAQRCQHKIKQRRSMQHANKHALGQVPWSRSVRVLLMQLGAHSAAAAAAATQERLRKCGGRQGGDSHVALSHSRSLSASHAATPAPCPQEIPQGCCDVRLPSSSAASCFREDGLVHQQQRISMVEQTSARKMVT